MANARSQLDVIINGEDQLSPQLAQLESKLIRFVGAISSAIAAVRITAFPITAAGDFERELANVAKTTNFLKTEMNELSKGLLQLSLTSDKSALDLAKIAAAAGQQGLGREGVENVLKFTDSVARMASVLDITAEQAGKDVGKILNIFKIPLRDVEKVVSAFNETANNSTAEGIQLLDVVKRLGDAAGSLKLTDTIGLAATGLDLGLSPEVIGTSFTAIFSRFRTESEKFKILLKGDYTEFVAALNNGEGIKALTLYNARLRQLTKEDQASAIAELSGSGRIFGLKAKEVQDTLNAITTRNAANAALGFRDGTSALKEQARVLDTFNAQVEALKNSLFKLAVEAGTPLLENLTDYAVQLNKALQSEGFVSFVTAAAKAVGETIDLFIGFVKAIAALNINWENFIGVLKLFLGLKLVKYAAELTGAFKLLGGTMALVSRLSGEQGKAVETAGKKGKKAIDDERTALEKLYAKYQEGKVKKVQAAQDAANLTAQQNALAIAEAKKRFENDALARANSPVINARLDGNNAAAAQRRAEQEGAAAVAAREQKRLDSIAKRQQAHNASLLLIQKQHNKARSDATRAAALALAAQEVKNHQTSINRVTARHQTEINKAQAAADAKVAIAAAEVARTNAIYAAATAARDSARAKSAAADAALIAQQAKVADATKKVESAQSRGALAGLTFAAALRGIVAVAGRVIGALTGMLFWFTALYSVLDFFDVLPDIGGLFTKLTDVLGLTSEAARKDSVEREKQNKLLQEQADRVEELRGKLKSLNDEQGNFDQSKLESITDSIKQSRDPKDQAKLFDQQGKLFTEVFQVADADSKTVERLKLTTKAIDEEIKKQRELLAKAEQGIGRAEAVAAQAFGGGDKLVENTKANAAKQAQILDELMAKKKKTLEDIDAYEASLQQQNLARTEGIAKAVTGIFTEESAAFFSEYAPKVAELRLTMAEAEKKLIETTKSRPGSAQAAKEKDEEIARLGAVAANTKKELDALIAKIREINATTLSIPGLSQAAKDTNTFAMKQLIDDGISPEALFGTFRTLAVAKDKGIKLLGSVKVPKVLPSSGNDRSGLGGKGSGADSAEKEASKLARARIELAKNEAEAFANIQKQANEETLARDSFAYQLGLLGLGQYFTNRRNIELRNNELDKAAKKTELEQRIKEQKDFKKESDKVMGLARIAKAKGELAVIEGQAEQIKQRALRDAKNAILESVKDQRDGEAAVAEFFQIDDLTEQFDLQFSAFQVNAAQRFDKMRADFDDKNLAEAIINKEKAEAVLRIIDNLFAQIANKTARAEQDAQRYFQVLAVLRTKGSLTDADIIQLEIVRQRDLVEQYENELRAQEDLLAIAKETLEFDRQRGQNAAESSLAYQRQADAVDDLKVKLFSLRNSVDVIARSINDSITFALEDSLTSFVMGEQTFLESFKSFGRAVSGAIVGELNRNIAQNLSRSLMNAVDGATGGTDGVGGFFSRLIRGDQGGAKLPKNDGSTAATAIYVRDADGPAAGFAGAQTSSVFNPNIQQTPLQGNPGTQIFDDGSTLTEIQDAATNTSRFLSTTATDVTTNFGDSLATGISTTMQFIQNPIGAAIGLFSNFLTNALTSLFSPSGFGTQAATGLAVAAFGAHTGGIVGNNLFGRSVNPFVFTNALRYHSGGVAGLRPDEVPTILQKGEEVLTRQDPRHRNNGGAGGGGQTNNVTVNVATDGNASTKADGDNSAQLGKVISSVVLKELQNQKRPGGLLAS